MRISEVRELNDTELAKELGVTATPTPSADPVADALASGTWVEKKDDKGKSYYYNKTTKKTTLGHYPDLSLKNARLKSAQVRIGDKEKTKRSSIGIDTVSFPQCDTS